MVIFPFTHNNLVLFRNLHGSGTFSLSIFKVSNIIISILKMDLSLAIRSFVDELSLEFDFIWSYYYSFSFSITHIEITFIDSLIFPNILSLSMRFPFSVFTIVCISIGKMLFSFSMFQEILERSFIFLAASRKMNSMSFYFTFTPLTDIAVLVSRFPDPSAMPESILPFAIISFPILPNKTARAMPLIPLELTLIVSLRGNFIALNNLVSLPTAFKFRCSSDEDS